MLREIGEQEVLTLQSGKEKKKNKKLWLLRNDRSLHLVPFLSEGNMDEIYKTGVIVYIWVF